MFVKVILWNAEERDVVPPGCSIHTVIIDPHGIRVSEVFKKAFIQSFRTISEKAMSSSYAKSSNVWKEDKSSKAFIDPNRYEHVRLKIRVWQSQSERRSQSTDYNKHVSSQSWDALYDSDVGMEGPNCAAAIHGQLCPSTCATQQSSQCRVTTPMSIKSIDNVDYLLMSGDCTGKKTFRSDAEMRLG
ncbi:hypothetical protein Tco_0315582 [Tanacetum coccineum]